MIGCFAVFAATGFFVAAAMFMGSLMAYFMFFFTTMSVYMSVYMSAFVGFMLFLFS